jgi:hypothetical protein
MHWIEPSHMNSDRFFTWWSAPAEKTKWRTFGERQRRGGEKFKVKVQLPLCFNLALLHGGLLGNGGITPLILDLGTRWRWVVSFTPCLLYPQGKSPWYPLGRRLGGPQSRSGHGGEEKNFQPLSGFEPSIIQPVSQCYTAELNRIPALSVRT